MNPLMLLAFIPFEELRKFLVEHKNKSAQIAIMNVHPMAKMILQTKLNVNAASSMLADLFNYVQEQGYEFSDIELKIFKNSQVTVHSLFLILSKALDELVVVRDEDDDKVIDSKALILANIFTTISGLIIDDTPVENG